MWGANSSNSLPGQDHRRGENNLDAYLAWFTFCGAGLFFTSAISLLASALGMPDPADWVGALGSFEMTVLAGFVAALAAVLIFGRTRR